MRTVGRGRFTVGQLRRPDCACRATDGQHMTKSRLIFAGVIAAIFAIPMVTLVSMMVVFPIIFYAVIAAIANFGPLVLLPMYGLQRLGYRVDPTPAFEGWLYCSIIWVGCAFGFAHWGDVGASIGARNMPYFDVLFAPYRLLLGYVLG